MILYAVDVAMSDLVGFNGTALGTFRNSEKEVSAWVSRLPFGSVVALEPTASYGELLALRAYEAGHTVYMVQPAWIKAHRASQGKRAKTDAVDAKMIHEYVVKNVDKLHPWHPRTKEIERLRLVVRQRQGVAHDLARMRQRYVALKMHPDLIKAALSSVKETLKTLDQELVKQLKEIPESKYLLSIRGIGPIVAAHLLVALKHIPFKSVDSFIAWIGLDPVPQDSGTKNGPRRISKKGDVYLRNAMYIAAMSAATSKVWKPRYEFLKSKGLAPKQALVALAKKLAVIAFHLFKKETLFDPLKVALSN